MRRRFLFFIHIMIAASLTACSARVASETEKAALPSEAAPQADAVQSEVDAVGGALFHIETTAEYPTDHETLVDQAAEEQEENLRPELASHVENFGQYEYVFLGYPKMEQVFSVYNVY